MENLISTPSEIINNLRNNKHWVVINNLMEFAHIGYKDLKIIPWFDLKEEDVNSILISGDYSQCSSYFFKNK